MQNKVDSEQGRSGQTGGHGGKPGSGKPAVAAAPTITVNGVARKLALSARGSKQLSRPALQIAPPGKAPPEPPASASLRSKCPPVLDQDPIQSCAAFAFTGALRFLHLAEGLDEPLSPLFCYYATRVLVEAEQTSDDSGCKADAVVEALENYGVCVESVWPYDTAKFAIAPPVTAFDDAAKRKLTKAYRVTTLRAIKLSIAAGYPVPVAFPVARSVGYGSDAVPSPTWRTGIFPVPTSAPGDASAGSAGTAAGHVGGTVGASGDAAGASGGAAGKSGGSAGSAGGAAGSSGTAAGSTRGAVGSSGAAAGFAGGPVTDINPFQQPAADPADGYHFVLAVGYDDATGLLEIQNSWGTQFGDGGYGYLPYALFGPTQDTLIADPSVLAEDPWTLRRQSDDVPIAAAAR
ncbi:C1 family peptidase [Rhodanobacter sp. MP1X3]|uniref:C1 family peptidase n=1 Tax=Rhodanobacter sp. MP1X3 TaxID=2723086 RepID=UPI00161E6C1A|nr:C1 family peptidase [Rhodanobacter sp. MP1X3]MBB6243339.1 hypothetical protein [Rhodanobacter sp. MP1X3]